MTGYDLVVVGGGLIGSALAWGASRSGASVALLDEGDVAFRASRGNFGLIWLQGKGISFPPYMHWSLRAGRLWQQFADELEASSGIGIGWRPSGGLHFCFSDEEMVRRQDIADRTAAADERMAIEVLDRRALGELLPGLGPEVVGASFSALDAHVNPLRLLMGLQKALVANGGRYLSGFPVETVTPTADSFAVSASGREVSGRHLVLAAGLGVGQLAPGLGLSMPVRPERGQILVTERLRPFFRYASDCLRQTDEGTVLLGSSHEERGFDEGTDVPTGAGLCRTAIRVFPGLAEANITRTWGSLRIMSPDGLPIYASSREYSGCFGVTCHSGVTLASIHALEVGPALAGGKLPPGTAPFSSDRFHVQAN
jgi:glycine/D-amino acid oxidase-like deaminating enzyme